MSFSSEVKAELAAVMPSARHCQIAELAGILTVLKRSEGRQNTFIVVTENEDLARKFFTLIKIAFNIDIDFLEEGRGPGRKERYRVVLGGEDMARLESAVAHPHLLSQDCCRRSYLRGVFLSAGSISDPEKDYHFEIVAPTEEAAQRTRQIMNGFGLDARSVLRKKHHVVYLKEGDQIVQALAEMGAGKALMALENVRIFRQVKGNVNRQMNCDAANISRVMQMAARQQADIEYLRDTVGFGKLPEPLRQVAELRLQFPAASLTELGEQLDPPIGKSGVNHRLRKLAAMADAERSKRR